jgi:hypothetical protein
MRHAAIAVLGLLGLGLGLTLFFGCGGSENVSCVFGYTGCGRTCVDTTKDVENCGDCGVTCIAGGVCVAGKCTLQCADSSHAACPTASPTACVDTKTDPVNCGGCGIACPLGQGCTDGFCTIACPKPTPDLCGVDVDAGPDASVGAGAFCTDLSTDITNCGVCGKTCPDGAACVNKSCVCGGPLSFCDPVCVDAAYDPANCGTCGNACAGGLVCIKGTCGCPGTLTACNGVCVDTFTSSAHCGGCMMPCAAGKICINGKCA